MKLFISAGEASGDALGAHLLRALREREPGLEAFGMGGPLMAASGFRKLRDANEIGVVGLVEVLRHLPRLFRLVSELAEAAIAERPDAAVLVDVPDFNIRLARKLTEAGIPVIFYVGPSVWAWRPGRVRRYAPWMKRLLVLFPFEVPIWQRAGVDVVCVGHPLLDELPAPIADARQLALDGARTVALLPGSRRSEIRRHLATLLEAAALLAERKIAQRFVLPVAPTLDAAKIAEEVERSPARELVTLVAAPDGDPRPRREAIARSELALVASGTATLETALVGRPQVIFYRVSWLSWILGKPFVRVSFMGLVNLIAGREIAPELLQGRFDARRLADAAARLLADAAARRDAIEGIAAVRDVLGEPGAAARAADAVLEVVRGSARRRNDLARP